MNLGQSLSLMHKFYLLAQDLFNLLEQSAFILHQVFYQQLVIVDEQQKVLFLP
jgi:hypothetical protein